MVDLPTLFREALASSKFLDVEGWWSALDDETRREAIAYWDTLGDSGVRSFHLAAAPDDVPLEESYWSNEFYDYLVNHEIEWFKERTYHICHQTSCAQQCLRDGIIASNFACPIHTHDCFMEGILRASDGKRVQLRLVPDRACLEL